MVKDQQIHQILTGEFKCYHHTKPRKLKMANEWDLRVDSRCDSLIRSRSASHPCSQSWGRAAAPSCRCASPETPDSGPCLKQTGHGQHEEKSKPLWWSVNANSPLMSAFSNRTQMIFSFSSVGGAPVYACGCMDRLDTPAWIFTITSLGFIWLHREKPVSYWTDPVAGWVNYFS